MAKLTSTDIYGSLLVQGTLNTGTLTTTGTFVAPLGTALLPSYTFSGDLNTGIYSPGADLLSFSAGGIQRLLVGSDVSITGATDFLIAGASRRISFTSGTGTIRTTTANSLSLGTNSTDRLTILSDGNVGIGTASPSAKLEVTSPTTQPIYSISSEKTSTLTNQVLNTLILKAKTSADMVDGFGPLMAFNINDSANEDNTIASISALRTGADNSGRLVFRTANSGVLLEKMIITPAGNVGVGITNPSHKLDIYTTTAGEATLAVRDLATDGYPTITLENDARIWKIYNNGSLSDAFNIYDQTASQHRFLINSSGNVGIGTTSPGVKLDVIGSVRSSENFRVGTRYIRQISLSQPANDAGPGRWFVRLWATSSGAAFSGGRVRAGGLWNFTPIMGVIEIEYGIYVALNSTSINSGSTRFTAGTGSAYSNLRIGNLEVVSGFVGFYVYSANTNLVYVDFDIYSNIEPLFTFVAWESFALPSVRPIEVLGSLTATGQLASTIATGTAPFSVSSTTAVTNLNADLLDGLHASSFQRQIDESIVAINSPASSSGTWVAAGTSDWGPPRIGSQAARYNDNDGMLQYNIPAGMDTAYISHLSWSSGGYVDVYGVQADAGLVFLRRINTRQSVENSNEGDNQHDGSTVTLAATGLSGYTAIRLQNKLGRFHFTGMSFTSARLQGAEGTGMVHPGQLSFTGTGSGLDADLLDGLHESSFLRSDAADTASGILTFSNATASTATNNGALIVTGGVGIGGALNVGGEVVIGGNLTINGTTTTLNANTLTVDDKNIELGSVVTKTGLVATLATGTNSVTLTTGNTSGVIPGQKLVKTSGTGVFGTGTFGAGVVFVGAITSATVFTVVDYTGSPAINHATAGSITFSIEGASDTSANGGGITVKGTTDKTFIWNNDGNFGSGWYLSDTIIAPAFYIPDHINANGDIVQINPLEFASLNSESVYLESDSGGLALSGLFNQVSLYTKNNNNIELTPHGTGITTTARPLTVTDSTASTTTSTGALVVTGGVGIGGTATATAFSGGTTTLSSTSPTLTTTASGAKTANFISNTINATATSSTASITKTGLSIDSTGTWNGTSAVNRALYVNATGGTNNYAAIFDGGNVGIGTTAPAARLNVVDSSNALGDDAGGLYVTASSTTNKRLRLGYHDTGDYGWIAAVHKGVDQRILALNPLGGGVSIGTTTAVINTSNSTTVSSRVAIRNDSTSTNRTEQSPTLNLVNDSTVTQNQMSRLGFSAKSGLGVPIIGADITAVYVGDATGNGRSTDLVFGTTLQSVVQAPSERMRITAAGNVGIGRINPQDLLNIHNSSANANIGFKITRGTQTHGLRLGVNDEHAFLWTTENQNLAFATNNAQRMTIAAAGNIGIGTTSPAQKLEVVGNTKTQDLIISDKSNVAKATMTYDSTSKSVKFVFA